MISRFVLLRHEVPDSFDRTSHWDFLLERDETCWTWALDRLPAGLDADSPLATAPALRLPDHRKHYLEYEGPISNDRGTVHQVLAGECHWLEVSDDQLVVQLLFDDQQCRLTLSVVHHDRWLVTVG